MDHVTAITQKSGRELTSSTSKIGALEKMKVSEKFAVFWHEECFLHKIQDHPEQPDRVSAILTALRKIYSDDCFREAPLVTAEQILLFHTASHLKDLITLCDMSEKGYDENDDEEMYQSIDGDTVVMWKTRRAVWRAAGSAVAAIDDLYLQPGNSRRIRYLFKKLQEKYVTINLTHLLLFGLVLIQTARRQCVLYIIASLVTFQNTALC